MDAATKKHIQIKIFVGCEVKDLNTVLNKNHRWREAKISQTTALHIIRYQDKEYIGLFLASEQTPMKILKETARKVQEEAQQFCPEKDLSRINIQIFPQVFVS